MNKTFWQGLLNALFIQSNPPTPKTTHQTLAHFDDALEQSLAHDWRAVGGDIHLASVRTAKAQSPSFQASLLAKLSYHDPKTA